MAEASTSLTREDLLRDLECPVCQEHFRDPRILQCGHTICFTPCLEQIVGTKPKFNCPECRTEHDVPSTGLQSISKNVVVARQLSAKPKKNQSNLNIQRCPLCSEEDELRGCGHCDKIICMDCVMKHLPDHKEQLMLRVFDFVTQTSRMTKNEGELIEKVNQKTEKMKTEVDTAVNEAMELIIQKAESVNLQVESVFQDELLEITNKYKNSQNECHNLCQKYRELYTDLASESATLLPSRLRKISEMLASDQAKLRPEALSSQIELQHIHVNVDMSILREALEKILVVRDTPVGDHHEPIMDPGPKVTLVLGIDNPKPLQLTNPFALVVDDGNGDIIVADTGNNRIQRYTSTGQLDFCFGAAGSNDDQFSRPIGILVNSRRQMVIADENNHRIKIHNSDGSLVRVFGEKGTGTTQFRNPCGVGMDSNDCIHVCDWHNRQIQVFTEDGVLISQYQLPGHLKPYRICFTGDKKVIILAAGRTSSWNVVVLKSDYMFMRSWEVPADSLGLGIIGNTHIVVSIVRMRKLVIYDLKGNLIREFGVNDIPQLERPRDLAADKYGNIFVACEKAVLKIQNILS